MAVSLRVSQLPPGMCREVSQPLEGAITIHLTPHFHGPRRKVLGFFVESWKSSPFHGIPQPHRKYSEKKKTTIKILSSASFLSNFLQLLHLFNYVEQSPVCSFEPIQTRVPGAHPSPRQPSGIFPLRQKDSKPSALTDLVYKSAVSIPTESPHP